MNQENKKRIPESTISRLNLYLREVTILNNLKIPRISSADLGERTNLSDAQIRKDLNYFGSFGKTGSGYAVPELVKSLRKILGRDESWSIAVIGAGSLGSAFMKYPGFNKENLHLTAAFDNDPGKIGQAINNIPIYDISQIREIIQKNKIAICVITVPAQHSQAVADEAVAGGIKCLLNFAPVALTVPEDVIVRNVDLSGELETLTYFLVH